MIEEIEGATAEPARRRHVVALSTLVAWVSLALLLALVLRPAPLGVPAFSATPAPSATGPVMTIASNPVSQLRVDLSLTAMCADGTRLSPPYLLAVDMGSGRVYAVNGDGRTGRSVPVVLVPARSGWLTVSCATPDVWEP